MALKTEIIYSRLEDKSIKHHLATSIIWTNCEHFKDVSEKNLKGWWKYTIKFDGLKPVQCIKIEKIK